LGILAYDAVHKAVALAPILMAACRIPVYLIAASAAVRGVTGMAVWSSLALGCYIIGLSYLAQKRGAVVQLKRWPLLFLGAPFFLAWLVNDNVCFHPVGVLFFGLLGWVLWSLQLTLWKAARNVSGSVSMLLAGIALVDCLAVGELASVATGLCLFFFVSALMLQQRFPAT
jgi:hypothetical protein